MTEGSSALVYIDANPFMYAFESGLENAKPIMALIEALKLRPGAGVTSEITLGELREVRRVEPDAQGIEALLREIA